MVKYQDSPDKMDEHLKERFYQKARKQVWYEGKGAEAKELGIRIRNGHRNLGTLKN